MKKKMLMYVYSDIKTDARVMRTVEALKEEYELTLIATNSMSKEFQGDGFSFIDYSCEYKSPLLKYIHSLKVVWHYLRVLRPDYVYCHDYYAAPIAWIVSGKSSRRCVYDAHELYLVDEKSSLRERVCCFFERRAISNANLVICASRRRKEIMEQKFTTKKPIVVIDNISILPEQDDPDSIIREHSGLAEFLVRDIPTIVYCGAIIKARRIDKLLSAANQLKGKVQVLVIGAGEDLAHVKQYAQTKNLNDVFWCDSVPYKNIKAIIRNCWAGYIYYENDTLNNTNCAPNKIFEYASAGLPMIANSNAGLVDIVDRYQIGCASDEIKIAIENVIENYTFYKDNLDRFLCENSWNSLSLRLREAIRSL